MKWLSVARLVYKSRLTPEECTKAILRTKALAGEDTTLRLLTARGSGYRG